MFNKITISIIIILLFVIIVFSAMQYKTNKYYSKYELNRIFNRVNISEIYDSLKSGDIILFKGYGNPFFNILCDCFFQHAAMVVKYNDILYIVESTPSSVYIPIDYKNKKKYDNRCCNVEPNLNIIDGLRLPDGTGVSHLLVRLKYHYGDSYLMRINKDIDINTQNNLLLGIKKRIYFLGVYNILSGLRVFHCFQFINYLLIKMNLVSQSKSNYSEHNFLKNIFSSCNFVSYIYNKKLNNGYQYSRPIHLLYDL